MWFCTIVRNCTCHIFTNLHLHWYDLSRAFFQTTYYIFHFSHSHKPEFQVYKLDYRIFWSFSRWFSLNVYRATKSGCTLKNSHVSLVLWHLSYESSYWTLEIFTLCIITAFTASIPLMWSTTQGSSRWYIDAVHQL